MDVFEEKVLEGLKIALEESGWGLADCRTLGVAVSGGADSVSLLCAMKSILPEEIELKAITVNHNIRPRKETCGDADYVEELCSALGVSCKRLEIERGLVGENSKRENKGLEDSARKLRYEKFDLFIEEENIDFLCLAHNKNDQYETLLMRILQGSSDLGGIPRCRGKFLRPLIDVSRGEIERYLADKRIEFRTDSTNLENDMVRNRIRNVLVPVLDEKFSGWKKGLESLSEKHRRDKDFLDFLAKDAMKGFDLKEKDGSVTIDADHFYSLQNALKDRILMEAVKNVGPAERIPQSFLMRWADRNYAEKKRTEGSSGLSFALKKGFLCVEKKSRVATEEGFFAIIEEPGVFFAGGNSFNVKRKGEGIEIICGRKTLGLSGIGFPFAFRSRQPGDEVKSSGGTMRSLSKILDGWKVSDM